MRGKTANDKKVYIFAYLAEDDCLFFSNNVNKDNYYFLYSDNVSDLYFLAFRNYTLLVYLYDCANSKVPFFRLNHFA